MPTCPSPSEHGFTLIEMLVVLTILGIAAALLAGRLGDRPSRLTRERESAAIAAKIETARSQAIRTGRTVAVELGGFDAAELRTPFFGARLAFFADGSSSGGVIALAGEPVFEVDWLTGHAHAAR